LGRITYLLEDPRPSRLQTAFPKGFQTALLALGVRPFSVLEEIRCVPQGLKLRQR